MKQYLIIVTLFITNVFFSQEPLILDSNQHNTTEVESSFYNYRSYETAGDITSVSDVPNQRTINDLWVSNPHQILTTQEANELDQLLKSINSKTGYEVAVVVLKDINTTLSPYEFGLDLFNAWGIGQSNKNNGLLIMVLTEARNLTFITGSGTELVLSDAKTNQIGDDYMKPDFKKGKYADGIKKGLNVIEDIFEGSDVPVNDTYNFESETYGNTVYEPTPWYQYGIFKLYLGLDMILTGIYVLVLIFVFVFVKNLHRRYHIVKFFNLLIFPILFPLPFAILFFINKKLMSNWRNTIRFSKKTGEIMHKLSEEEEDEYLTKGQITEELVKSIDYDVWVTQNHDDILILGYKDWINKYHKCPSCGYKTYYKQYDKTLVSPTYSSSGTGEKKYYCENCKYSKVSTYHIPKLTRSSSGGSYSSGGSSSGGSSWGGGFSSGGGSSSGW